MKVSKKPSRDITGQKFGRLTAIRFVERRYETVAFWEFSCDCGEIVIIRKSQVVSGRTKSCGCYRKEVTGNNSRTHGLSQHPLYNTWCQMRSRCFDPNDAAFQWYGARGIKVCDSWNNSFAEFLNDMGERPSNHSLDRIDNNKDYCKENCRWSTQSQQLRNYSRNIRVEYNGENYCLKDLCSELGISYGWADQRWKRGQSIESIIPEARLI